MSTIITRQLTAYVNTNNTWQALVEGVGGATYVVPSSGSNPRADMKLLRFINQNTSGSAIVSMAVHSATPDYRHEIWNEPTVIANTMFNDDSVHVLRSGEKVWVRVVDSSGSPGGVVRASILEVS